ncbi:hypothetical protein B0J11DRAFT_534976 [Dendryphion nanum]|uniref:Uncharacterized protein n=1 Tax=Dendryphion nanum TaxID=256645 RepID=A0A9P9DJ83_9PLEO|nr:hypothetical protein B0J11DRAFT_534976 [Dendryphion nanum]
MFNSGRRYTSCIYLGSFRAISLSKATKQSHRPSPVISNSPVSYPSSAPSSAPLLAKPAPFLFSQPSRRPHEGSTRGHPTRHAYLQREEDSIRLLDLEACRRKKRGRSFVHKYNTVGTCMRACACIHNVLCILDCLDLYYYVYCTLPYRQQSGSCVDVETCMHVHARMHNVLCSTGRVLFIICTLHYRIGNKETPAWTLI